MKFCYNNVLIIVSLLLVSQTITINSSSSYSYNDSPFYDLIHERDQYLSNYTSDYLFILLDIGIGITDEFFNKLDQLIPCINESQIQIIQMSLDKEFYHIIDKVEDTSNYLKSKGIYWDFLIPKEEDFYNYLMNNYIFGIYYQCFDLRNNNLTQILFSDINNISDEELFNYFFSELNIRPLNSDFLITTEYIITDFETIISNSSTYIITHKYTTTEEIPSIDFPLISIISIPSLLLVKKLVKKHEK